MSFSGESRELSMTPRRGRGSHPRFQNTFEGRLVYPTAHGQQSLIVEFHQTTAGYICHLPEFNEVAHYLVDALVEMWPVAATRTAAVAGRITVIGDPDVDSESRSALEQWPAGTRAHYFLLTPNRNRRLDSTPSSWTASSSRHQRRRHSREISRGASWQG